MLELIMFVLPSYWAVKIHNYLRHGKKTKKEMLLFFILYLVLINSIEIITMYARGIKGFDFSDMTLSFKIKYICLGVLLGFFLPFPMCLITEKTYTLGGVLRFTRKFLYDLACYIEYSIRSAKSELHAEVKGAFLDWLWWMIEPFAMMIVYTLVFGYVFKSKEQYFPAFVFIGITMWSFFSRSVNGSVSTVRMAKGIITKVYIPKYILLLSKMFVNGFKMLVSFGITVVLMVILRVPINVTFFYSIPILFLFFLFTFGIGTILMHYGVFVSDLGYITGIVLNILMYLSGPFYDVAKRIPEPFGDLLQNYNPVAFLMAQMRNALLYGISPNWLMMGVWTIVTIVLIALGCFTIYYNENSYVKVI